MARKKVEVVDETRNIALALKQLCIEKELPESIVKEAMQEALKKAYFKYSGDYPDTIINVEIDLDSGSIKMTKVKNVVAEIEDDVFETDPEEAYEETGVHYNVGDIMETPIDINAFQRVAARQAGSVFKQKLREAEKQLVVDRYADKVGYILTGTIDAVEDKHCVVKLSNSNTNAYLSKTKTLPGEKFKIGETVKVYVEEVDKSASGAPIIVSRIHPRFITRLMEQEISEIGEGLVEIKHVSRQPGSRSKVAVYSKDPNIDPSGACIGTHGLRIARVLSQIGGEKIDVVNYSENPALFVADALKPAVVVGVQILDANAKACRAIVADDQFSLAIGKEAQNVNLAVRLTGWKIDIKSVTDAENNGYEYESVETLKFIENAKKSRPVVSKPVVSTPVVEAKPVVETKVVVEEVIEEVKPTVVETKVVVEEVKPAVVETKPVEEEVVVVKPTKATRNSFSELEAALNASNTEEEKPTKRKSYKKVEEKEEEKVEVKKTTVPSNVLPVYTEEELRAIAEEEEYEDEYKYDDDDIDYDEFDSYYDDED